MESPWYDQSEDLFWSVNSSEFLLLDNNTVSNLTWDGNFTNGDVRHWKPSPGTYLGIAVYLTIVGIVSTIGNILFIITATRWRLMRNNAHMLLLLNMAICDLAISIVGYPYTTVSGYAQKWIFGDLMCTVYAFLCFTFAQVSMNTLMAVSIFRYIAICKPHCKHLLTTESSWIAIAVIWAHALFWTVTPLLGWSSYTMEPTQVSCSLNWFDRSYGGISYTVGCIVFCYLTHVFALIWCYKQIFSKITHLGISKRWRSKRQREQQADNEGVNSSPIATCESVVVFSFTSENLSPLELHVLRMNILMVGSYILCWTPYAGISFWSMFDNKIPPVWYIFPTMFAKASCAINPLLYGLTNRFLRKELLSVIKGCFGLTTPIEEFQIMRQRQQEGLINKEGVYTGRRAKSSCACERCQEDAQTGALGAGNISQRKMIDIFVQQLRERDVEEERSRLEQSEALINDANDVENEHPQSNRPNSLQIHERDSEGHVTGSVGRTNQLKSDLDDHQHSHSVGKRDMNRQLKKFSRLDEATSDTSNTDTIIEDLKGYDSSQTASPFNNLSFQLPENVSITPVATIKKEEKPKRNFPSDGVNDLALANIHLSGATASSESSDHVTDPHLETITTV